MISKSTFRKKGAFFCFLCYDICWATSKEYVIYMRKLALSQEILLKVEKPARYIGNEVNSYQKNMDETALNFCMCFPDLYEIGMSHLGMQILYDMFNQMPNVYCDRLYSPWTDLTKIMKEQNIPLFAVESQRPIKDFDFLGITIQYEMCYTNILQILDLSNIPLLQAERGEEDPIVIGGGPCTYNPEPLADFFDLFYIGEGETRYQELFELYIDCKQQHKSRSQFLLSASQIPGIYVPSLYEVSYHEDGTVKEYKPKDAIVPLKVRKEIVLDLDHTYYPEKPIVPYIKAVQDRVVLEIQRGCMRGCRFCQAGMIYRPVRERGIEFLKDKAIKMLRNSGHEEISLSSLSSSDYSHLEELLTYLISELEGEAINISLPSLRIDAFSLEIMKKVQDIRKSSLTFAPEAGTQRLRNVINKGLTEETILNGASMAFCGGWNRVKLYFMLGLPTENEEDIEGIAILANEIAKKYYEIPKEERNGKCQIVVSTSFFVPKPFTPFQWAKMDTQQSFREKAKLTKMKINEQINKKSLKYNWHEEDLTILEGIFARGDRKLSQVLMTAYNKGCLFDSWSECFNYAMWLESFTASQIDMDFYTIRERSETEVFPWDIIDCGVTKKSLLREWHNAKEGIVTLNCKEKCNGCGIMSFNGGICLEATN